MSLFDILGWVVGGLFAAAALLITIRMVRGRSLLDRMIASDVLLTTVILVLGAAMVINDRTDNIVLMIVIAAVSSFAAIAVARTILKQDRQPAAEEPTEPAELTGPFESIESAESGEEAP